MGARRRPHGETSDSYHEIFGFHQATQPIISLTHSDLEVGEQHGRLPRTVKHIGLQAIIPMDSSVSTTDAVEVSQGAFNSIPPPFVASSVEQIDPGEECRLGFQLLSKLQKTVHDEREAFRHFQSAAKKGYIEAEYQIGKMYERGIGTINSERSAYEHLLNAATTGHREAQLDVGLMLCYGREIPTNQQAGVTWIIKAATTKEPTACYMMGLFRLNGFILPQDRQAALRWFEAAANMGNLAATTALGVYYLAELGPESDLDRAITYLKQAASNGYAEAQYNLCLALLGQDSESVLIEELSTCEAIEETDENAGYWLRKAAENQHHEAQYKLGIYLLAAYGDYPDGNPKKQDAYEWLQRAGEQGHPDALWTLAQHFRRFARGYEAAIEYCAKAARAGNKKAGQAFLNWYQEENPKSGLNDKKRTLLFALQGHPHAMFDLAESLYLGVDYQVNPELALEWYKAAALRGHAEAQRRVSFMLEIGEGVTDRKLN